MFTLRFVNPHFIMSAGCLMFEELSQIHLQREEERSRSNTISLSKFSLTSTSISLSEEAFQLTSSRQSSGPSRVISVAN